VGYQLQGARVNQICSFFSLVDLFEFSVQDLGWIFLLLGDRGKFWGRK
jgi:hypothetical protein